MGHGPSCLCETPGCMGSTPEGQTEIGRQSVNAAVTGLSDGRLAQYRDLVTYGELNCTDASKSPEQAVVERMLGEAMGELVHEHELRRLKRLAGMDD